MAIIDADGLFNGRRLRGCSNQSRLIWPYLFLASNGFGRIEIDYYKIVGRAFSTFRPIPTEDELMTCVREYAENYLLFLYQHESQTWGQWDVKDGTLPSYKTIADKRSPAPPGPEFRNWQNAYLSLQGSDTAPFAKSLQNVLRKFSYGVGIGVGVGEGVGKVKNIPASGDADRASDAKTHPSGAPDNPPESSDGWLLKAETMPLSEQQDKWFDSEFWPAAWRKSDKLEARRAFKKKARTEAKKNLILAAEHRDSLEYMQREPDRRPYMATWLNKERFDDGNDPDPPAMISRKLTGGERAVLEIQEDLNAKRQSRG